MLGVKKIQGAVAPNLATSVDGGIHQHHQSNG